MSRIKIILLILIIAALGIVFIQNREPIALRLLCADNTQSCLYRRTPQLPLALWIGLFTLLGAIVNLLVQMLNNSGYLSSRRPRATVDDDFYSEPGNRQNKSRRDKYPVAETDSEDFTVQDKFSKTKNYEVKQEPQNIERSGSTYSYKYREAGDRSPNNQDRSSTAPIDSKNNTNQEQDDEDWI